MTNKNPNTPHLLSRLPFNIWQAAFGILICTCLILIVTTVNDYGISSDEHLTVAYGKAIYDWYASGFQDQSVFQTRNTWLYGGFVNLVVHIAHQILGGDIYDISHICNALIGLLGILAAYRIGTLFGGPRAGFLSALFLLLIPRYYGHIFNNPRDIPFAVFYLWSIYFLLRLLLTGHTRQYVILTGLAIGLTLGVRAGGVVLWFYTILFLSIQWWLSKPSGKSFKNVLIPFFSIVGISYLVMSLFWPHAQVHPVSALSDALQLFSSFPDAHVTFFNGQYLGNDEIPRSYALTWLLLTLPELILVSVCIAFINMARQYYAITLQWSLLAISALFPLAYAVVANTPLYDGLRHLLFIIPPLVIVGALGIHNLLNQISKQKQTVLNVGLAFFIGLTTQEMVSLHPYQYVYFNTFVAGGIEKASQNYETDYWEHSYKAGIQWIASQTPDPQRIGSFYDSVEHLLKDTNFQYVRPDDNPDYYLGTTRYDRHRIIPGKIVHIVKARSVPVLYVIRPDTAYQNDPFFQSAYRSFYLAEKEAKKGNRASAIRHYKAALPLIAGKERKPAQLGYTHLKIGNLYSLMDKPKEAQNYYQKAIQEYPTNRTICATAYNNIGLLYAHKQDYEQAISYYQKAAEYEMDYTSAHENTGDAYANMNQIDSAIEAYKRALTYAPKDADLLHKYGMFCYLQNRPKASVDAYQKLIQFHPYNPYGHYHLGLALTAQKDTSTAIEMLDKSLSLKPDYFEALYLLGKLLMSQKAYHQAENALVKAKKINPNIADLYNVLGVCYVNLDRYQEAKGAFIQATKLDPTNRDAKENLEILSNALQ